MTCSSSEYLIIFNYKKRDALIMLYWNTDKFEKKKKKNYYPI